VTTTTLQGDQAPAVTSPDGQAQIKRLMIYFGVVYFVEGTGQTAGIINQPISHYLKEVHAWTPVQVTAFLTVFTLPWVIKPLYGLISDFVPLFGYRRKTYLILANLLATGAYLWAAWTEVPNQLLFALLLTAYGMAISSTLCGALLVENGQRYGASGAFVNQQWLWFNIAYMIALLIGGQLIQHLSPTSALHSAALIGAAAPLAVVFTTWYLVSEERRPVNIPELKAASRSLVTAFKTRTLWIVAGFLFLYYFSPGFTTPLYYYQTDTLHFSQGYIGILGAINAAGSVVAALVYRRYMTKMSSKRLLQLSIILGTVSSLSYLLLLDEPTAAVVNFGYGFATMIALVATLTLAADYCPKNSEGFAFAALMSVTNLSGAFSDNVGAYLYEQVFESRLTPLVLVSAAATAFAWVLIPLLRLGDKTHGQALPSH
jgi:MFS family permease